MTYTPCKFCGGQPEVALQKAVCLGCGASTRSFVGMGGDCQREDDMAMYAWYRGYITKDVKESNE